MAICVLLVHNVILTRFVHKKTAFRLALVNTQHHVSSLPSYHKIRFLQSPECLTAAAALVFFFSLLYRNVSVILDSYIRTTSICTAPEPPTAVSFRREADEKISIEIVFGKKN